MSDAVVVSTARTGLAKSWRGALNMTYGATLGAHAVQHAVERARIRLTLGVQMLEAGQKVRAILGRTVDGR